MSMKYVCIGVSIVDDIIYADGRRVNGVIGGGGFYAYTGLLMVEPESIYLTGAGPDYPDLFGDWYRRNGASFDGFYSVASESLKQVIAYDAEGNYHAVEGPFVDCMDEMFDICTLGGKELEPFLDGLKGIYTANSWLRQSPGVAQQRKQHGFKVMWEYVPLKQADLDAGHTIDVYLQNCDIWSINRPEAFELFGVDTVEDAISAITAIPVPCLFRVGENGAYMIMNGEVLHLGKVVHDPTLEDVSPTGCGNTSIASAMWAFSEGKSPREILAIANTVSGVNAMYDGPVPLIDDELRRMIFERAEKEMENITFVRSY